MKYPRKMQDYTRMNGGLVTTVPWWKAVLGIFLPSLVSFVVLDGIWIKFVAGSFYNANLKPILKPDVDLLAAALSWICIVAVNQLFVLPKTKDARTAYHCPAQGALMGVLLYGTVDLTNCALLTGWSWPVALLDMAWGTIACTFLALVQNRLYAWVSHRS